MEKHGVCAGEGEAPPAEKQGESKACCGERKSCGEDPLSKMADSVAGGITRQNLKDGLATAKDARTA